MHIAHALIAIVGGTLAALWVWFGDGGSLWRVLLAYVLAGNAACVISAVLSMTVAMLCPRAQDRLSPFPALNETSTG